MGKSVLKLRPKIRTANSKGLTIAKLFALRRHNPDFINSAHIRIQRINPVIKGGPALAFKTLTVDPKTTPPRRTHYQRIYPADPDYEGTLLACPRIKITCDCERWKFQWEYACFKKGAADVIMGNGKPPTEMNLRGIPTGCKHLLKDMQYIIRNKL